LPVVFGFERGRRVKKIAAPNQDPCGCGSRAGVGVVPGEPVGGENPTTRVLAAVAIGPNGRGDAVDGAAATGASVREAAVGMWRSWRDMVNPALLVRSLVVRSDRLEPWRLVVCGGIEAVRRR
jgi:hypothetical protein